MDDTTLTARDAETVHQTLGHPDWMKEIQSGMKEIPIPKSLLPDEQLPLRFEVERLNTDETLSIGDVIKFTLGKGISFGERSHTARPRTPALSLPPTASGKIINIFQDRDDDNETNSKR